MRTSANCAFDALGVVVLYEDAVLWAGMVMKKSAGRRSGLAVGAFWRNER